MGAALIQILAANRSNNVDSKSEVDRLSYGRDKFQHFADSRVNDA